MICVGFTEPMAFPLGFKQRLAETASGYVLWVAPPSMKQEFKDGKPVVW